MLGWTWLDTNCPPSRSVTPLLIRTGQGESKMEENLWVNIKGSLIKQKKKLHMQKQRKPKDLFSTSNQQAVSSHSLGSRASVCIAISLEDKHLGKKCFSLPLSLTFYCWADITWYGISLWAVWVSCPRYVASKNCAYYLLTAERKRLKRLCWCCVSSSQQQLKRWCVINTFLAASTGYKHSTVRAAMWKINSTSAKPYTVNYGIS